ncbi:MAG: hypothetical protein ABFD44_02975 [Anaerolineaceae bacterium]
MANWNLGLTDPLVLTLAADARMAAINSSDDQIWELNPGGGEPRALAAETTYGLRARRLRLFPQFAQNNQTVADPLTFHQTPRLQKLYPNWLRVQCAPFQNIDVLLDYRVPSSQVLCGRVTLTNTGELPHVVEMNWVVLLTPLEGGSAMRPFASDFQTALVGQTDDLYPVFYLSGGPFPGIGAFPALASSVTLAPGVSCQFYWALAAMSSQSSSLEAARHAAAESWEPALARIELINQFDRVDIETPRPDWNTAFMLSQNSAWQAFNAAEDLILARTRQPDNGWRPHQNGSRPTQPHERLSALSAFHWSSALLPGAVDQIQTVIQHFLSDFNPPTEVVSSPQSPTLRLPRLSQPVLADLVWRCHTARPDPDFLHTCLPALLNHYNTWFTLQHDQDGDGLPEWENSLQTGLENHPLFDAWLPGNQGVSPSLVESPALGAMLYRETSALLNICRVLSVSEFTDRLQSARQTLQQVVESMWDGDSFSYHYRDRDTHGCQAGRSLWECDGEKDANLKIKSSDPLRLQVRITSLEENTHTVSLCIRGISNGIENEERLDPRAFRWYGKTAVATSRLVFTRIDQVTARGLSPQDHLNLQTVDHTADDCSLYLPLWAGIPAPERAADLVAHHFLNPSRYQADRGIPSTSLDSAYSPKIVSPLWNTLLIEGLLKYDFRREAAAAYMRLLEETVFHLQHDHAFFRGWDVQSGRPDGERGNLQGLLSASLFFSLIGVEWKGKGCILIHDYNPLPWEIKLKYRGITVLRRAREAQITFHNGSTITVQGTAPQMVTLD